MSASADNAQSGQLALRDDHFEHVEYTPRRAPIGPNNPNGAGYYAMVECTLGPHTETWHHYLALESPLTGRVCSGPTPYVWRSVQDAFAAIERWNRQQAEKFGGR